MQAVSDTSPLRYLLVTDLIDLLPQLFERIVIPAEVRVHRAFDLRDPIEVRALLAELG